MSNKWHGKIVHIYPGWGSLFSPSLADLGGIEPYRHEIAQWYMTFSKLQKRHPNHQPTVDFRATSSSSPPHTPYSHFVREKQLRLACRLAFVIHGIKMYRTNSNSIMLSNSCRASAMMVYASAWPLVLPVRPCSEHGS